MDTLVGYILMVSVFMLAGLPYVVGIFGFAWLVSALIGKEVERSFRPVVFCVAGVLIPFFVFMASTLLMPDWKGACRFGWLDCFLAGKIALTPLVMWACTAFVSVQNRKAIWPPPPWIVLGLFMGAIVSTVCFLVGVLVHFGENAGWFLLVPFYVSIWYSVLAYRAVRATGLRVKAYILTVISSLPLWGLSVLISKKSYIELADNAPTCFVVTATLRGHERIIGPLVPVRRGGGLRLASVQLLTFWQLEELWRRQCPDSHRYFRAVYNRVGPLIARCIRSKYIADTVHLLLKPLEMLAFFLVKQEAQMSSLKSRQIKHAE